MVIQLKVVCRGLKEGEKVTLEYVLFAEKDDQKADSAYVKDGKFTLKGIAPEGPRQCFIHFDKHPFKKN